MQIVKNLLRKARIIVYCFVHAINSSVIWRIQLVSGRYSMPSDDAVTIVGLISFI